MLPLATTSSYQRQKKIKTYFLKEILRYLRKCYMKTNEIECYSCCKSKAHGSFLHINCIFCFLDAFKWFSDVIMHGSFSFWLIFRTLWLGSEISHRTFKSSLFLLQATLGWQKQLLFVKKSRKSVTQCISLLEKNLRELVLPLHQLWPDADGREIMQATQLGAYNLLGELARRTAGIPPESRRCQGT